MVTGIKWFDDLFINVVREQIVLFELSNTCLILFLKNW